MQHLEWRKKYQVADLTDDWKPIEVLQKCYPVGIIGEDKSGSPGEFLICLIGLTFSHYNSYYFSVAQGSIQLTTDLSLQELTKC